MKKKLLILLTVSAMIFGLTACGTKDNKETAASDSSKATASGNSDTSTAQTSDSGDNSLKYIQDNGKLIVGLDDTFAPMGFRDDKNNIVGFDVDLAKAVGEKLGVEVAFQPIDWDAKEQELSTKQIDCIWNGFSITPDRLENLTMSKPYMENKIALVVNKDSGIASQADMKGKKLAVQSGSSAEEALNSDANKAFKDSIGEVNSLDSYTTALMDLETGSSDAVLMDSVMANYMITEGGKDFVVLDDSLVSEQYGIGFRKGDNALSKAVDDALSELKADGTVAKISTQWFGSDVTTIK